MRTFVLIFLFSLLTIYPLTSICNDAVVLNYSTTVEVQQKKLIIAEKVKIQVNNPKGDKFTNFTVGYDKHFKLKKLKGQIIKLNGNVIRKLASKNIQTTSSFSISTFYNDNFVKRFSLKHNQYPYIVEVSFQRSVSPYIGIVDWNPVYNQELDTDTAILEILMPVDFKVKINCDNIGAPTIRKNEGTNSFVWKANYRTAKNDDIFAPPYTNSLPFVSIFPLEFNYIKPGSFESWKANGEWLLDVDEGLDELTDNEKKTIDRLTNGKTEKKEIVSILYHYLQDNTRYVNVDIKLGGLLPYPASYVCNNRFGDCKALTNYMKSMLTYKGVPSNKVIINAGNIPDKFYPNFPSLQWNHVILAVPIDMDTIWLECTSNYLPLNYLGTFTHNRPVHWIEKNKSRIINTPALTIEESRNTSIYQLKAMPNSQQFSLEAKHKLRAEEFEDAVYIWKAYNEKEKKDHFSKFLNFKNYQPETYLVESPNRDSSFVVLTTNGTCNSPMQSVGDNIKLDLPTMYLPVFEKVSDREQDVSIYRPLVRTDTIQFNLTQLGIEVKSEKNILVERDFGRFEQVAQVTGEQLLIIRKYEIPIQTIPLSKYKDFYSFLADIKVKGGSIYIKTTNN